NREKYARSIDYPSVYDALDVIKKSGSVCVLAHPSVYDTIDLMKELAENGLIHGIELNHPRNTLKAKEIIVSTAKKYDLILTGGTDFHGFCSSGMTYPLGSFVTDDNNIQKLLEKDKL
ncbi:MAG: PHP domain-containing protein, partial [Oscillospiraceae bacterium]